MDKTTLKQWFSRGKRPSGTQFGALIDSFFHVDEDVPVSKIGGLEDFVDGKTGEVTHPKDDYICGKKAIEYGMEAVNSVVDAIVLGSGYRTTHVALTGGEVYCDLNMGERGYEEMHICNISETRVDVGTIILGGKADPIEVVEVVPKNMPLDSGEAVMAIFMRCASEDAPYDIRHQKLFVHLIK